MTPRAEHAADLLAQVLRPAGARFGVEVMASLGALLAYAEALLSWNRRVNLTGARNLEVLASEHLADALAVAPHLPRTGRWVDVGSGGGLPGMVLAILRRDLQAVLLEPLQKRRELPPRHVLPRSFHRARARRVDREQPSRGPSGSGRLMQR